MQSSVRAVEAYRRSRLIDNVTSDEDKVSPVYRLEEICTLLRNSPLEIVREMLEYTLKRLEHKSPIVKQKTLRFIKYASTKAGQEWRREMQRQAQTVRQLFHYRGTPDALKGDSLNKAVRETAHEAVAAIFGTEEKAPTMEDLGKRIQGFGSTNFDMPREEEKKSVLSELVGFGSNSIRQAVDSFNNYNNYNGSSSVSGKHLGSYRGGQNLRRSLTSERERPSFEKVEVAHWDVRDAEADGSGSGSLPNEKSNSKSGHGGSRGSNNDGKGGYTSEDRFLDSLTHAGGVRLQPTRETLQTFTLAAQKLDAGNLVNSFEKKFKAHSWQVRFKALCLLEASVRSREDSKVLESVVAMFEEDASTIVDSLQSPQATLREKAKKVMEMIGGGLKEGNAEDSSESLTSAAVSKPADLANMPDLIDTRDFDLLEDTESIQNIPEASNVEQSAKKVVGSAVQQDLLLDGTDWFTGAPANASANNSEADPFAGLSFHKSETSVGNGGEGDIFTGLDMDGGSRVRNGALEGIGLDDSSSLFDGLSVTGSKEATGPQDDLRKLMGNLSTGQPTNNHVQNSLQNLTSKAPQQPMTNPMVGVPNSFQAQIPGIGGMPGQVPALAGVQSQMMFMPGVMPMGMPGYFPSNLLLQQALASGNMNFALAGAFGQQQFAGGVPGMAMLGGIAQSNNVNAGLSGQNFRDGFDFSGNATARLSVVETPKEDTKAFDFISDHMSNVLAPRKSK